MLVVWQLGWVEIDLGIYTTCWAAGVMAEWAEQVGRLVELENLSQHNLLPYHQHHPVLSFSARAVNGTPTRYLVIYCLLLTSTVTLPGPALRAIRG